jgi:hypothetical protein
MTPRVFLCEPSGLSAEQRLVGGRWRQRLVELGFDIDQLRVCEYQLDPWSGLLRRIDAADGVLVLGFSQLSVSSGIWRRGTDQETEVVATWTSSWLHLEAGMAIAAGVPVLVAPESNVRDGVFASDTWTGLLRGTTAETPDASVIQEWGRAVAMRSLSRVLPHRLSEFEAHAHLPEGALRRPLGAA